MRSSLVIGLACVLVLGTIACEREVRQPPAVDVAYKDIWKGLDEIEGPEDKVSILEAFIADYPDTEQSEAALGDVIYFRTHEMNDLPGAISIARATLGQTRDPELRFKIGLRLHKLSAEDGEPSDLAAVADELAAHRELGFVDHFDVVEAAEKSGSWELMLEHAVAMADFATEAAFRAAYPDEDFTDERVAFSVNRRRAWVLAYQGGALTHLGRLAEAGEVFELADDLPESSDFLGIPETPIDIYRGQAALLSGQPERALELFAHDALMGGDPRATEGMRQAFMSVNGSAEGFDEYSMTTRRRIARSLPDVTLEDYAGDPVNLVSMTGKVMVVSFWNPG